MAFQNTSDDIVIDAVLTDVGRKKMAKGDFKVTKFALGDDEIDYRLFDVNQDLDDGFTQPLVQSSVMEAYGSQNANIVYGLQTFPRQDLMYLPILNINSASQVDINPDLKNSWTSTAGYTASAYYLSVNQETTDKINSIFVTSSFRFLETDKAENRKIIIESGISGSLSVPSWYLRPLDVTSEHYASTDLGREYFILEKELFDQKYFVYADGRLIEKIIGIDSCGSIFRNFPNGTADINFTPSSPLPRISYDLLFDNYSTYIIDGIENLISDFDDHEDPPTGTRHSSLGGPRGSVTAINFEVNGQLKTKSTGERDYRYTNYGSADQYVFDKTHKFDYIDTTIYVLGMNSKAFVHVPLRIIRYTGT